MFSLDHLNPVWPVPVIVALVGVAAGLTLLRAVRGKRLRPSWLQPVVVVLRWASLGMLALILLNPTDTVTIPSQEGHALILLDGSASMKLAGKSTDPAQRTTRWQEAAQWTQQFLAGQTSASQPSASLTVFGSGLQPISTDMLERYDPQTTTTQLAAALTNALHGATSQQLDHIIIVSDGVAHDRQNLTAALAAARTAGLNVSTKLVGIDEPSRNAALTSVQAPRMTRPKSRVVLPVTIQTSGIAPTETLTLFLKDEDGIELVKQNFTVPTPVVGQEKQPQRIERKLSFESGARSTRYTVSLGGVEGEIALNDNQYSFTIETASTKLRVLFAEGTHASRPVGNDGHYFNEMEFITKAWDATGEIESECFTPVSQYTDAVNLFGIKQFVNGEVMMDRTKKFPQTREELNRFDVVMVSDVPVGNFNKAQMEMVVDWVNERGGGFLMAGGNTGFDTGNYDQTPWEKIIPVDMLGYGDGFYGRDFRITIAESVRNHPLWQIVPDAALNTQVLATHPPFHGMNRIRRAKPGATVLASIPEEDNEPVIAAQNYGRGRSIAFLPDPNGGWGDDYLPWGSEAAAVVGPRNELGQRGEFTFHEDVAKAARGPIPQYPSIYYGQFWVNVAKWLGENSVRWRRDKLAGKALVTQAQTGQILPVGAEVLAVTKLEALLALNVGARLDLPGSPRVRLQYDRDRREFTGQLQMPVEPGTAEVKVLFDTSFGNEALTDIVSVGVQVANQEFVNASLDLALMQEIATAGDGKFLTSPADAVTACAEATKARSARTQQQYQTPRWTDWWWWGTLIGLLALEWWLRRIGSAPAKIVSDAPLGSPVPTS
jgi:uncharacterized membrane protein